MKKEIFKRIVLILIITLSFSHICHSEPFKLDPHNDKVAISDFKSKENLSNAYNNQKNMLQERQSALEARENQFINNNILVQFSDSIVGGGDFAVIDDEGNDQCDTGETEEDDVDRTDTRMIVIEDGEIKNDPRTNQEELFDIEDIGKKCDETQDIELITDSEIVIDSSTNNNKQEFYYIKEAHNFLKNRREEAYKKFEEQTKPYYDKLHEELVLNSDLWKDWNKKMEYGRILSAKEKRRMVVRAIHKQKQIKADIDNNPNLSLLDNNDLATDSSKAEEILSLEENLREAILIPSTKKYVSKIKISQKEFYGKLDKIVRDIKGNVVIKLESAVTSVLVLPKKKSSLRIANKKPKVK